VAIERDGEHAISRASWAVWAGRPAGSGEPMNTPIVPASNFTEPSAYARSSGTPTWAAFEDVLAGLEGGRAIAFSSGMAAISAVLELVPIGGHVAIPSDCYQGVASAVAAGVETGRWTAEEIDVTVTGRWIAALKRADLGWIESPTNPLLEIADLTTIAAAPRSALLAIDNTFATPMNQRPLEVGADISVHSVTKFLGGHSDLLMGAVAVADEHLFDRLTWQRSIGGATPGALEAYLATRGLRTLPLRMERSQDSAALLAERLAGDRRVHGVRYPGLPSHRGHALAAAQLDRFGAMVSFEVLGGLEAADRTCRSVRLIHHTTSLGGVESTMERRSAVPGQEHLPAGLIRLSVGIEDPEDLWSDLSRALDA
jgi:cystathionine gamma-synthase